MKTKTENMLDNLLKNYNPKMDKTIINLMSIGYRFNEIDKEKYLNKLERAWKKYQMER